MNIFLSGLLGLERGFVGAQDEDAFCTAGGTLVLFSFKVLLFSRTLKTRWDLMKTVKQVTY